MTARTVIFAATALLVAAPTAAPAQYAAAKYGQQGPFQITMINEGGKFSRCAADINGPGGMMRIAWFAVDRTYWVSIPGHAYKGLAPQLKIGLDGAQGEIVAGNGNVQRPGTKLSNQMVDAIMKAKSSIEIDYDGVRFKWLTQGVDMTNVFVAMENCVNKNTGR
ncbi:MULTISPECIES: hypothetical protein [unclassified Sphingobium]|uniref:hypothetical protein n=1 Tax=unclassified Sphingobium TaxID=2611147 RepID=UPI0035A69BD0